jgi:hypothetical protein
MCMTCVRVGKAVCKQVCTDACVCQHQDLEQAKRNADEPAEDEPLRRRLWLRIARHVVEEKKDIRAYVHRSLCGAGCPPRGDGRATPSLCHTDRRVREQGDAVPA